MEGKVSKTAYRTDSGWTTKQSVMPSFRHYLSPLYVMMETAHYRVTTCEL